MKKLLLTYLLSIILFHCHAQNLSRKEQLAILRDLYATKHAPEKLKLDIDFVYKNLKENHPDLYSYIPKKELAQKIDSLKNTIYTPLTSLEFSARLMSVLGFIGDGHMEISPDIAALDSVVNEDYVPYNEQKLRPVNQFHTVIINDRLFILKNYSTYQTIKLGSEILKIEGKPIKEIITALKRNYIASDGYNESRKYQAFNNGYFATAYSGTYGIKDSLTYLINNGDKAQEYLIKRELPILDTVTTTNELFKYIGLNMMKIGQFSSSSDTFYQNFFQDIKTNPTKSIVIDLRNSPGGDLLGVKKLYSFLIDREELFLGLNGKGYVTPKFSDFLTKNKVPTTKFKHDFYPVLPNDSLTFKGKIYLLINGGSFSGASILPANLKGKSNVVLVGSETGGGANGCTAYIYDYLKLPSSKLTVRYGLVALKNPNQVKTKGRGVMPDVEINYTLQDYLDKKDLEMDWIIEDIQRNK